MNRETIIQMAREAGFDFPSEGDCFNYPLESYPWKKLMMKGPSDGGLMTRVRLVESSSLIG